jgi:hypothetical protein
MGVEGAAIAMPLCRGIVSVCSSRGGAGLNQMLIVSGAITRSPLEVIIVRSSVPHAMMGRRWRRLLLRRVLGVRSVILRTIFHMEWRIRQGQPGPGYGDIRTTRSMRTRSTEICPFSTVGSRHAGANLQDIQNPEARETRTQMQRTSRLQPLEER